MSIAQFALSLRMLFAVSLMLFSGCGGSDLSAVSGVVTLDGQPLAAGTITFIATISNKTSSSGGLITDGRFMIPAKQGLAAGDYKISLVPMVITGRQVKVPMTGEMTSERISVGYQEVGQLKATVVANGENVFNFAITRIK